MDRRALVEAARSAAGLNQVQLAELLGISTQAIRSWQTEGDSRSSMHPTVRKMLLLIVHDPTIVATIREVDR